MVGKCDNKNSNSENDSVPLGTTFVVYTVAVATILGVLLYTAKNWNTSVRKKIEPRLWAPMLWYDISALVYVGSGWIIYTLGGAHHTNLGKYCGVLIFLIYWSSPQVYASCAFFWLQRLNLVFQDSFLAPSKRLVWWMEKILYAIGVCSIILAIVGAAAVACLQELHTSDFDPYPAWKSGNEEHKFYICQTNVTVALILIILLFIPVLMSAVIGYMYSTRMIAIRRMMQQTHEMERQRSSTAPDISDHMVPHIRKTATIAITACVTNVLALVFGGFGLYFVPTFDVAFNSVLICSSFAFGEVFYNFLFVGCRHALNSNFKRESKNHPPPDRAADPVVVFADASPKTLDETPAKTKTADGTTIVYS